MIKICHIQLRYILFFLIQILNMKINDFTNNRKQFFVCFIAKKLKSEFFAFDKSNDLIKHMKISGWCQIECINEISTRTCHNWTFISVHLLWILCLYWYSVCTRTIKNPWFLLQSVYYFHELRRSALHTANRCSLRSNISRSRHHHHHHHQVARFCALYSYMV